MNLNPTTEPVRLSTAITAALVATVNVLALIFDWSSDLVAGLNLAIGAWVVAISLIVRGRVTPTADVALTKGQEDELIASGFAPPEVPS